MLAQEIGAPASVTPVVWRLLTNQEAYDADAVIEMFSHSRKSTGCSGLWRCTWWWRRIARLMRLGRTCPELDASPFFHADEIRGAFLLAKKSRPNTPVTINRMIPLIASLGEFLGRKSDDEPGAKNLWIGIQRTMDAASTIQAALRFSNRSKGKCQRSR